MHLTFCAERKKGVQLDSVISSMIRVKNQLNGWGPLWFSLGGKTKDWPLVRYHKINEVKYLQSILFSTNAVKLLGQKRRNPKNRHLDAKSRTYVPLQDGRGRHGLEECMLHKLPLQRWLFTQKKLWRKVHRKNVFYTIYTCVVKRSSDEISVMRGGEHKRMDNFLTR